MFQSRRSNRAVIAGCLVAAAALVIYMDRLVPRRVTAGGPADKGRAKPAREKEKPAIAFDATRLELGNVPVGLKREVFFVFKNQSETPVQIGKVHTSCGCMEVSYPKAPVAPGASEKVTLSFEPRVGKDSAPLLVELTNGQQYPLDVISHPYEDAFVSTKELRFPPVLKGKGDARSVDLMGDPKVADHASVSVVGASVPWLKVTVDAAAPSAAADGAAVGGTVTKKLPFTRLAAVRVQVAPEAPAGRFSEGVGIRVKDPQGTRVVNFACVGEVTEPLSASPSRLVVLATRPGHEERITLRSATGPFRVLGVESDVFVCGTTATSAPAAEAEVALTLRGELQGRRVGSVRIRVDHPAGPELVIPVVIVAGPSEQVPDRAGR